MVALHSADIVTHFVIRTQLSPISNGRLNCNRAARNTRAVHQNSQTEQVTKRLRRNRTHSTSAWCKCTLQVVIQNLLFLSAGFRESSDISLIATIVELSSLSPAGPLGARSDAITPKEIAELHWNCPSNFSNLARKARETSEALNKQQKSNHVVSNSGTTFRVYCFHQKFAAPENYHEMIPWEDDWTSRKIAWKRTHELLPIFASQSTAAPFPVKRPNLKLPISCWCQHDKVTKNSWHSGKVEKGIVSIVSIMKLTRHC